MKKHYTKVTHYSQKITSSYAKLDSEVIILELFVAFLAAVFAYIGYAGGILFLFILNVVVFLMAIIAFITSVYYYVKK